MRVIRNTGVYVSRIARREIDYYRRKPTNILLFLTYRCTSRCRSCTMWKRSDARPELSLDQWKRFIDDAAGYGIRNVEMFGGDALLRKDVLLSLTKHIKSVGIPEVDLPTNCNLLDEETAYALVDAGINVVYASLDGVDDLQDEIRGVDGAFEHLIRCIGWLRKARGSGKYPKIVLNCTVSRLNLHGLDRLLPFAKQVGADKVAFEYVGEFTPADVAGSHIGGVEPLPYFTPQESTLRVGPREAVVLKRKVADLKRQAAGLGIRISTKNIDSLGIRNLHTGEMPNRKCYVCRYLITADPFGNIIPCPFYGDYVLGNVSETPVRDIWDNGRHRAFMKAVGDCSVDMCRHCILGVERNPTPLQSLIQWYFVYSRRGYDQP